MLSLGELFELSSKEELLVFRTTLLVVFFSFFCKSLYGFLISLTSRSRSPSSSSVRFTPSSSPSSSSTTSSSSPLVSSSSFPSSSSSPSSPSSSSSSWHLLSLSQPFNYPHIALSETLVSGFRWLEPSEIKCHEEYIEIRHSALFNYLNSIDSPVIVPCIILCSQSLTIIDGHHRFSVMKKLGWQRIPVLLLRYQHPDIITHPLRPISKNAVIQAGISQAYLPPKSTQHMVRDLNGGWHPIACLSLMVEYKPFDHLDTSQLKQLEADQQPSSSSSSSSSPSSSSSAVVE